MQFPGHAEVRGPSGEEKARIEQIPGNGQPGVALGQDVPVIFKARGPEGQAGAGMQHARIGGRSREVKSQPFLRQHAAAFVEEITARRHGAQAAGLQQALVEKIAFHGQDHVAAGKQPPLAGVAQPCVGQQGKTALAGQGSGVVHIPGRVDVQRRMGQHAAVVGQSPARLDHAGPAAQK